jgi:hypothetical protein
MVRPQEDEHALVQAQQEELTTGFAELVAQLCQ